MKHQLHARVPDQLAQTLERAIVRRDYMPGQRLPAERIWAQTLGVSRATLREALRLLAERGLVVQRHGAGSFVTEQPQAGRGDGWAQLLQRQPLMQADWLEFREMLEMRCAELAARRAQPEDLARLERCHEEVNLAYAGNNRARQVQADVAFHRALADAARNPVFSHLVATLMAVLHEHVLLSIADLAPNSDEALQLSAQHRALWRAVAQRQPEAAAQAARQHIAYVKQRWAERAG